MFQFLTFGMLSQALMIAGNAIYLVRSDSFGGGRINMKNRLTQHLLFDVIFFCVVGTMHFGFPTVVVDQIVSISWLQECSIFTVTITLAFSINDISAEKIFNLL